MRFVFSAALCSILSGCEGLTAYNLSPSDFDEGEFHVARLAIARPEDALVDFDGDGRPDDHLPEALATVDAATTDDLSADAINTRLADAIASGAIDIEVVAAQALDGLELAVGDGTLTGRFTDETDFEVGPGEIAMPLTISPDNPPVALPFELATVIGSIDESGGTGLLSGVIPIDRLVDDVIAPCLPDEGYDTNGDGDTDLTYDEAVDAIEAALSDPAVADIDLGDGRRGVSAVFLIDLAPR